MALLSIVAEELASAFIGALAAYSPSFVSADATRSAAAALLRVECVRVGLCVFACECACVCSECARARAPRACAAMPAHRRLSIETPMETCDVRRFTLSP